MGSVRKLLRAYEVGRKKSESHNHNQKPDKCRIQDIKGTTCTVLDCYGEPRWYWLLCIAYVDLILNCMAHQYLSWSTPYEATYGFTPDAVH